MSEFENPNQKVSIRIHEFFSLVEPERDAQGKETGRNITRDYVRYGPPHLMDKQAIEARIDRLSRVRQPKSGEKNIHTIQAWKRWEFIKPRYEAWKKGEELPENGTALALCNFLRPDDVRAMKAAGVRTVEELAELSDSALEGVKLPDMRGKRLQAKRFLEAQDTNKLAAEMKRRDDELAALKAQMAELMAARAAPEPVFDVDENGDRLPVKRGPGRPRKEIAEALGE